MSGSKREIRPGVWELRVYLGKDPVTGKKRQLSRTYTGGARSASRRLAQLVVDADRSTVETEGTVAHLLAAWVAELIRRRRSPTYIETAESYIRHRIGPGIGHIQLRKLTAHDLDVFYGKLAADGLADNSIATMHGYLSAALNTAVRWGWLTRSPTAHAAPPSATMRNIPPPSVDQLRDLVAEIIFRNPDLAAGVFVAATCGPRRGELAGLRWQDIDQRGRQLVVCRGVVTVSAATLAKLTSTAGLEIFPRPGGGALIVKTTKTRRPRRLSLDQATLAVLDWHRRHMADKWPLADDAFVFSSTWCSTEPVRPNAFSELFRVARAALGYHQVRLQDLRHFSVTTLLSEGVDARTVAGRHGHAPLQTLNRYGHFLEAPDRKAADIMGGLALPQPGGRQ